MRGSETVTGNTNRADFRPYLCWLGAWSGVPWARAREAPCGAAPEMCLMLLVCPAIRRFAGSRLNDPSALRAARPGDVLLRQERVFLCQ